MSEATKLQLEESIDPYDKFSRNDLIREIKQYVHPDSGIQVTFSLERLRLLAGAARKSEFSTVQIEAFLTLYREQLESRLDSTLRTFLEEKLK